MKALYTKLLFILTRCSRILVTEESPPEEKQKPTHVHQSTQNAIARGEACSVDSLWSIAVHADCALLALLTMISRNTTHSDLLQRLTLFCHLFSPGPLHKSMKAPPALPSHKEEETVSSGRGHALRWFACLSMPNQHTSKQRDIHASSCTRTAHSHSQQHSTKHTIHNCSHPLRCQTMPANAMVGMARQTTKESDLLEVSEEETYLDGTTSRQQSSTEGSKGQPPRTPRNKR